MSATLPPGGWIDPQVNGWEGVDFSSPDLSLDAVLRVADKLAARGTAAFMPTVTTTAPECYAHTLPVLAAARRAAPEAVLGIHLEGPFISDLPGAVGAHPARHVRMPSIAVAAELLDRAEGTVRLVTLAPERPGAAELTAFLRERGVAVGLGHALPRGEDVRAAADAGARYLTHFANGLPNTLHRHDNPLWACLSEPRLSAMLIADGHHLPEDVLRACWRIFGPERIVLVSDAAPVAGLPPGEYTAFGTRVRVEPSGRISNLEAPTLAGSSAALADCVGHMARVTGATTEECLRMGRDNARALIEGDANGQFRPRDGRVAQAKVNNATV